MMTGRKLIVALGVGALAWTCALHAQAPAKVHRIGLLAPFPQSDFPTWHQAFRLGLRDLGWIEGKNISIEERYAEGRSDRLPDLAAELVRVKVDIIVASGSTGAVAAQKATKVVPIVIVGVGDPVASGLVESLARPAGNITGLSQMSGEIAGKRLELLKEMVPKLSRVAVFWNPQNEASTLVWKEIQLPARRLGVELHSLQVRSPSDFDKAFDDAIRARVGALAVLPDPMIATKAKWIADLAAKARLPSIYHLSEFADAGGLVTYGPDRSDIFRRAATFVDKILKGAKPGDLPIEQPTKFELVVNMKTAKAIGLKIPNSILVRADKVIE